MSAHSKALHRTAIPLRFIAAGEQGRYEYKKASISELKDIAPIFQDYRNLSVSHNSSKSDLDPIYPGFPQNCNDGKVILIST